MAEIRKIGIIGQGALGVMYGWQLTRHLGNERVFFIADSRRIEKYQREGIYCNGEKTEFQYLTPDTKGVQADLLIFAVKYTAIEEALDDTANFVGGSTILLSLLNGIASEERIGARYGEDKMLYCVAQGMDAVKMGNELTYSHMGQICIGIPQHEPQKEAMLEAVTELFERTGLPYTREPDILRRLWCKWMLNVGVNQAVMVEEGTYGTVQKPGPARQMMKAAMAEVVELAGREGIRVTMEDLDAYVDLIDSLNPDGMPSMRQDGLARRPSEVEFFAGTVIRRAEAAGLDVPVNRELYRRIKGMERR